MLEILNDISYGVYVVGVKSDDTLGGCIANSVMQVTSNPEVVAISINHDNFTNELIKKAKCFAVNILSENNDIDIIKRFGYQTGREVNKYEGINYELIDDVPVLNTGCGYFTCEVVSIMETDTHTIFIGKIISKKKISEEVPMTYSYYHKVLKGTTPKNATTFREDIVSEIKTNRWRCMMCGYIYEGDSLPDDFTCPVCGVGPEMFELVK